MGGAAGTLYWNGNGGDPLAESDSSGTIGEEYIFFGSQRIARRDSSTGAVHYYFSDHLASHGVIVNSASNTCEQDIDYYPYGGVQQDYCPVVSQNYKFTGKERDNESGLDKFGARTYGSAIARFSTPDPLNIPALATSNPSLFISVLSNPQNWNSYQYGHNNPLSKSDMGGFLTIVVPGTWAAPENWHDGSQFMNQVQHTFGEKPVLFKWSGKLSASARHEAAHELRSLINNHYFKPGERLNVVTHSHGSNVAIEMTSIFLGELSHPINNLVTLGLPVMKDETIPNMDLIQNWINVWSPNDRVVPAASDAPPGTSPYTVPQAHNVEADEATGHSDLWMNPNVWTNHVVPYIPCYTTFGDGTFSVPFDMMADGSAFYPGPSGPRMNNQY